MTDKLLEEAAALLRPVRDFKSGITFWDISPFLRHYLVRRHVISLIAERWRNENVQLVAGFDARGFIFGTAIADALGVGFEQIRKKGKLPGKTRSVAYELEYGTSEVEMLDDGYIRDGSVRVLLVDDVLATGGTARAGVNLVEQLGGVVVGVACLLELPELAGRAQLLQYPVQSLISVLEDTPRVGVEYCVDALATDRETGELLLVERLDGFGLAMPGGRIEVNESIIDATHRELSEEANCPVLSAEYLGTLVGSNRDPRGPKVSTVLRVDTNTKDAVGEAKKTEVRRVLFPSDLPPPTAFAFDHGPFVHKHWRAPELV